MPSHLSWRAEDEFELLKIKDIEHVEDVAGLPGHKNFEV